MDETEETLPALERLPGGIVGLDTILNGGFFKGDMYLIVGPPGAGKTILGNQLCFNHVAHGGRAIYMTLLAESHSRMLAHLQPLAFFTLAPIGDSLLYLSSYSSLQKEGLGALAPLLQAEIRRQRASMLVLDGTLSAAQRAPSRSEWKQFLYQLHATAENLGCTTFLLLQADEHEAFQSEDSMSDGLLRLSMRQADLRTIRHLHVQKFRGGEFLTGEHAYTVSQKGFQVYPRLEMLVPPLQNEPGATTPPLQQPGRVGVGIARLNEMLQGGVLSGSITLLLGASGTGKTLLGWHFLHEGLQQGEQCLYVGFYETPEQLLREVGSFGLDVREALASEMLHLVWQSPIQDYPDIVAEQILKVIRERRVQRLFIDSLGGFQHTVASAERLDLFLVALFTILRAEHVTTFCSAELPDLFSPTVEVPPMLKGATTMTDNILFLRYVELQSQLYRLISLLKVRGSDYDSAMREFRISSKGIEVASTFASAQAILTGIASPATREGIPSAFAEQISSPQGQKS